MACPLQMKRVLCTLAAALLVFQTGSGFVPAWAGEISAPASQAYSTAPLGITGIQLSPDGTSLSLEANQPFTVNETRNLSVLRLPYPYRMVLEIPNARLMTAQNVVPVNRNGIERIEFSESRSPFYNAARAVIYVTDGQTLSRLNTAFEGSALRVAGFQFATPAQTLANAPKSVTGTRRSVAPVPAKKAQPLPPVAKPASEISLHKAPPLPAEKATMQAPLTLSKTPQTVLGTPVLPGTNLVEDVYYRDFRLYIKGASGTELRVKNRFVLSEPNRLVLDIDNAVLASKALTNPISGGTDDIRQIRVGQFDDTTVRVVIESQEPELFESTYTGSDRSLLAISPYSAASITRLSSNTRLGQVESIDLKREGGGTVLRLTASTPIVHRFLKRNDQVVLDLLNEAANPTAIGFDAKMYPEIAKMRLEPLAEGQPNSKLAIKLAGPGVRVVPTLSDDGKVLELLIMPGESVAAAVAPLLANMESAGKAPFPARIVVDAGHGGKDHGAIRNGVREKDLNLSLAMMVKDALEAKGFKVYVTRSTDEFLPLPQITAITNRIRPDLFISIHHNASVNPALNGIETYYYTPQSLALARRVHSREINNVGARDGGVKKAMFYVIHHTDVPAILCEVGYVSNPNELSDLQSWERKSKTARSIADGVVDYLKSRMSAKAK
jgi:N-acetylmuramoyl-L-alanine amidase